MKQRLWILCALLLMVQGLLKADRPEGLPNSVYVTGGNFHVQGIAIDRTRRCMYFSFTTSLVKTDLKGNVIGSVEHLTGHLGDLAIHPVTGDVYASLECKDDAIGASISRKLGTSAVEADGSRFYVAIFRADRLTRKGMDASADSVMTTVYLDEPTCDYQDTVTERGRTVPHRHGCSGIDGITFAPSIGASSEDIPYLYVGYGIYSDTTRTDNDHQVLLCYDVRSWDRYEKPMQWDALHTSGPAKPLHKYFVHTGNTRYGVQNLVYHPTSRQFLIAVYCGAKSSYPNYSLFAVDASVPSVWQSLPGSEKRVEMLCLVPQGKLHRPTGVHGWHFPWGSTGMCHVEGNYFYLSENRKDKRGNQTCTARLYRWTGDAACPFVPADEGR